MKKPVLVIMAAGMGSRYGGLKQIDPVGRNGEIILDYSLFDAKRAGFEKAIIVIKRENEALFREVIGDRASRQMEIQYAYQEMDDLPEGFSIPEGRKKPWGTGHAVLAARKLVDAPFCAINADDFYGAEAFRLAYDHLTHLKDEGDVAMVGYLLKNTDTVVSMNMWAFPHSMMAALEKGFPVFLREQLSKNPEKAEYYLPMAVDAEMQAGRAGVSVKTTHDKWYGVTNPEDKQDVVDAVARMAEAGLYPAPLWPEA